MHLEENICIKTLQQYSIEIHVSYGNFLRSTIFLRLTTLHVRTCKSHQSQKWANLLFIFAAPRHWLLTALADGLWCSTSHTHVQLDEPCHFMMKAVIVRTPLKALENACREQLCHPTPTHALPKLLIKLIQQSWSHSWQIGMEGRFAQFLNTDSWWSWEQIDWHIHVHRQNCSNLKQPIATNHPLQDCTRLGFESLVPM